MAEEPQRRPQDARLPMFSIACWALGLMAFCQLLVAALALSVRFENSRETRVVEKEVIRLVPVRIPPPAGERPDEGALVARPPTPPPIENRSFAVAMPPLPPPRELAAPEVADARAGGLVDEARRARVRGDMGLAIVKLEEANSRSPDDPTIHYELGLVHEAMGVFDTAAEHYQRVFEMGVSSAGPLYQQAAAKLRDGFEQPGDKLGKVALGNVRVFRDTRFEEGERVVLDIPIQKAPGAEVDASKLEVRVVFFNRTDRGEIVELHKNDEWWASEEWVSLPFDWRGGEEVLRVNYVIPPQETLVDEHLFGGRHYYGQVVTLLYGDPGDTEVLDVQARPRDLAARAGGQQPLEFPPLPGAFDPGFFLPPNFDPDDTIGVLPPLPAH